MSHSVENWSFLSCIVACFTSISAMPRKSRGRQKLEMVKIPNESNLMVTFSKRRAGLFKKASELSTLCGAEVCVIVFSPGKKVFSFGHPSVEKIADQFLSGSPPQAPSGAYQLVEAHRNARVRDLNVQLTQVLHEVEMERRKGIEMDRIREAGKSRYWWESPVQELASPQLEHLKGALLELKKHVTGQAEQILIHSTNPTRAAATSVPSFRPTIPPAVASAVPSFTPSIPAPPPPPVASFPPNIPPPPPADASFTPGTVVPFNPGNDVFNRSMAPYGYNLGFRNDLY